MSVNEALRVLLYSSDRDVRNTVKTALGDSVHPDLPNLEYIECATEAAVFKQLDAGSIAMTILDAESTPAGGMGIARQMKDEIFQAPPVLLLTARPQDAWLAQWSRAEEVVARPLDPFELGSAVTRLLEDTVRNR